MVENTKTSSRVPVFTNKMQRAFFQLVGTLLGWENTRLRRWGATIDQHMGGGFWVNNVKTNSVGPVFMNECGRPWFWVVMSWLVWQNTSLEKQEATIDRCLRGCGSGSKM